MNPIIVVEGTTDFAKIKQVGYKYCVKTCGFCVSRETINFLKSCSINRNIILLLDPDGPGRNIAKKIKLYIPEAIVLDPFKASESKRHGKVGIAYRSIEDLKKALINYPYDDKEKESITREELVELGLMGNKNLRIKIATKYNISSSSLNAIFEGLNMLNVTTKELKGTIENE